MIVSPCRSWCRRQKRFCFEGNPSLLKEFLWIALIVNFRRLCCSDDDSWNAGWWTFKSLLLDWFLRCSSLDIQTSTILLDSGLFQRTSSPVHSLSPVALPFPFLYFLDFVVWVRIFNSRYTILHFLRVWCRRVWCRRLDKHLCQEDSTRLYM